MDTTIVGYIIAAVAGLIIGRMWGARKARHESGMLTPRFDLNTVAQPATSVTPTGPASVDEILRLVKSGNKIEAIKLYRETTGLSLKESKEVIEDMERNFKRSAR